MQEEVKKEISWRPQLGPQTAFVHCTFADEIFFGGARGGGKTDAALGKLLIKALQFGKGMRGIFFRRTYKQLEEVILRAKELYPQHGAVWKETAMTFTFPNGAWIKLGYLDRDADADNYQGKSHTDIVIEEAGTFPNWAPIAKLKATLRSATGIPCQLLLTGNPGGPGANWVRARYIDPAPAGWHPIKEVATRRLPDGSVQTYESTRIYIPSRVTDNQILMQNDPNYIARLMDSGSEQLVKAWLDGDFYIIDGAFFDNFDQRKHVLQATALPDWWTRYRAMDWGSAKPFCCLWIAAASEDWFHPTSGHLVPKDALVVYREWYGVQVKKDGTILANQGLKLFAEEVGRGILTRERGDRVDFGVLDPSAFASDGGPSIAERIYRGTDSKVAFRRADNKRVGTSGAMSGWDQIRGRLGGTDHPNSGRKDVPMLFFFNNCSHVLRTLPMMQHDPDRPEDIDTTAEDHAADALRYGCMARPYIKPTPVSKNRRITTLKDVTLDQLWYDHDSRSQDDGRI
jgi:hypothetical protein